MNYDDTYSHVKDNNVSQYAFVDPTVILGTGNIIEEGVIIRAGTKIGDNNYFGPYCIIGERPEKQGCWDFIGGVEIGSNNRFTKQCTIDTGTERATCIGNNVIMLKNSHVGHDAEIHDGVTLSCNVCIGGFSVVGKNTNFGLGAVCHQRLVIPEDCMFGMNTTVTKKTPLCPNTKYVGSPAYVIGVNKKVTSGETGHPNCDC